MVNDSIFKGNFPFILKLGLKKVVFRQLGALGHQDDVMSKKFLDCDGQTFVWDKKYSYLRNSNSKIAHQKNGKLNYWWPFADELYDVI